MVKDRLIRDYENPALPIGERVASLARRFPCLRSAEGVEPWAERRFYDWVKAQTEGGEAWHAGHLILCLWGNGPWDSFDAVSAIRAWGDEERKVFATWARIWID